MNEGTIIQPRGPSEIGPGLRLNETYEIVALVGEGGLSQVYRAFNIRNRHPVAIKFLRADLLGNADSMELFQREASILAELSHDAIVRYLGFSFDPLIRREYLVMEFVEGVSLEARLRQQRLTAAEAMSLKSRLAGGLSAAHRRGAVHRDMSPDNVILPGGDIDNAKIIDFGIAKAIKFAGHTVIGSGLAGKFSYMSPEQVFGGEVTEKSDVYSLALVLAAALRGEPLDMGKTLAELAPKRATPPELVGVDPVLKPLIAQMLRPNPAERPSMDEVAAWAPKAAAAARKAPSSSSPMGAIAAGLGLLVIGASLAATGWVFRDDLRGLLATRPSSTSTPAPVETESSATPTTTPEVATIRPETPTPTETPAPSPSVAVTTPVETPVPTFAPSTPTFVATVTPTPVETHTPTVVARPSPVETASPSPTVAVIATPVETPRPSPTLAVRPTPVETPPPSPTLSARPTPVETPSPSPSTFARPTPTVTASPSPGASTTVANLEPPRAPTILTTLDTAFVGRPFRQALAPFRSADPEGIRITSLGRLPAGLTVTDGGRGAAIIEGTPTRAGTSAFGIVATDRNKRSTTMHAIAIIVEPPASMPPLPSVTPSPAPAPSKAAAAIGGETLASLLKRYEGGECWLSREVSAPGGPPRVEAVSADDAALTRFADEVSRLSGNVALDRAPISREQCPVLALARGAGPRIELATSNVGGGAPLSGVVRGLAGKALSVLVVSDNGRALSLKVTPESADSARFRLDIERVDDEDVGHKLAVAAIVAPRLPSALRETGAEQAKPVLSLGAAAELMTKLAAEIGEAGGASDVRIATLARP